MKRWLLVAAVVAAAALIVKKVMPTEEYEDFDLDTVDELTCDKTFEEPPKVDGTALPTDPLYIDEAARDLGLSE